MRNSPSFFIRLKTDRSVQFWAAFWITILLLLGLYFFIQYRLVQQLAAQAEQPTFVTDSQGGTVFSSQAYLRLQELIPELRKYNVDRLQETAYLSIEDKIDEEVEYLFAAVYRQIPKFANFHYSVRGEYTELASYLAGEIGENMQRVLFDEVEFQAGLQLANEAVSSAATETLTEALAAISQNMESTLELSKEDLGLLGDAMILAMEDVEARFEDGLLAARGLGAASGLGLSVAGMKVASKVIAKKVAAKAAAKGALKVGGIMGGAGSGAAAGSVFGPVGTVIGGVVGATIAWVATDAIIIEIDEYLNRDEFEADIVAMIDAQKDQIAQRMKHNYQVVINALAVENERALDALTPMDIIQREKGELSVPVQ